MINMTDQSKWGFIINLILNGKKTTTQTHTQILIIAVCVTMSERKKKKLTLTELVTCKFVILLHKYNVKCYLELDKQRSWIK